MEFPAVDEFLDQGRLFVRLQDVGDAVFELGRRSDDRVGGDADAAMLVGGLDDRRKDIPIPGLGSVEDGPGRRGKAGRVEQPLDPRLVVGKGQHAAGRSGENKTEPLHDRGHLRLAVGDPGELLAPVEDDVLPGIKGRQPLGQARVLDRRDFDGMAQRFQGVAERGDILFGFASFLPGPSRIQVVEKKDGQVAPRIIHERAVPPAASSARRRRRRRLSLSSSEHRITNRLRSTQGKKSFCGAPTIDSILGNRQDDRSRAPVDFDAPPPIV
ncbi:MAG: hypothetical protein BWX98_02372 [Candidatus Aminicenantes bacterium ADurb.Bin147]|nr:MAG: hypothetical protein BWX98_02372 [Candidatus Aminicenantes bacterium ADurb.Bin147]